MESDSHGADCHGADYNVQGGETYSFVVRLLHLSSLSILFPANPAGNLTVGELHSLIKEAPIRQALYATGESLIADH